MPQDAIAILLQGFVLRFLGFGPAKHIAKAFLSASVIKLPAMPGITKFANINRDDCGV
jgi:hypothetical protein